MGHSGERTPVAEGAVNQRAALKQHLCNPLKMREVETTHSAI